MRQIIVACGLIGLSVFVFLTPGDPTISITVGFPASVSGAVLLALGIDRILD